MVMGYISKMTEGQVPVISTVSVEEGKRHGA